MQAIKPEFIDEEKDNVSFSNFLTEVSGKILWEYHEDKSQINDLYEVAKNKVWNASKDINWDDGCYRNEEPISPEKNPLLGFGPYDSLDEDEKLKIAWWLHGVELSEILHGEQGALIIASQLVSCMPSVEAKLFASSQVSDEARHVEFFSRYLTDIVGSIEPPSIELKNLISLMISDPKWDMKFISCQILIESLAMAKFQEIKNKTLNPILSYAIDFIVKDEARHVKFGTTLLKDFISTLTDDEIQYRSSFVLDNVIRLANAQNIYLRIADNYNWDKNALRYHLRRYRILNPELNRNKFRQLAINLSAVGLLTEMTNQRLLDINVI